MRIDYGNLLNLAHDITGTHTSALLSKHLITPGHCAVKPHIVVVTPLLLCDCLVATRPHRLAGSINQLIVEICRSAVDFLLCENLLGGIFCQHIYLLDLYTEEMK